MAKRDESRVVVVGGGVAGLAVAWRLALRGARPIVLERERLFCTHSSGRNAAIFRHAEPFEELCRLALASRALIDDLMGDRAWLERRGGLYVSADPSAIDLLETSARLAGVPCERRAGDELTALAPALAGGVARHGLWSPEDGVIDIHRLTQELAVAARRRGAELRAGVGVRRVLTESGRAVGVVLDDGEELRADGVVLAAGAWVGELGAAIGAELPVTPLRRHLAQLDGLPRLDGPVVWQVTDEVYVRAEGHGVLASPCDEVVSPPCLPASDPIALETLADKLARALPTLAGARVRRYWAGLRTFAPDRNLVIGEDPRVGRLFWMSGLGGHGMTLSTGAGDQLARAIVDGVAPDKPFAPARLLAHETEEEHKPCVS